MSSESDEFQVMLLSNVKGNPRTKLNHYETEIAKPLDLPGVWDVAVIDISDPPNWTNLVKPYQFSIMRMHSAENTGFSLIRQLTNKISLLVLPNPGNCTIGR